MAVIKLENDSTKEWGLWGVTKFSKTVAGKPATPPLNLTGAEMIKNLMRFNGAKQAIAAKAFTDKPVSADAVYSLEITNGKTEEICQADIKGSEVNARALAVIALNKTAVTWKTVKPAKPDEDGKAPRKSNAEVASY